MGNCETCSQCNQLQEERRNETHKAGRDITYFKSGDDWPFVHNFLLGSRQSPIDIRLDKITKKPCPISISIRFPTNPILTKMSYTISGFKVNPTTDPIGYITITTQTNEFQEYRSHSLHYHTNSEHKINGTLYDGEMHMVFEKVGPNVLQDNFCVLGFIFNIDDSKAVKHGSDLLTTFKPTQPNTDLQVDYTKLFEVIMKHPIFYHYMGGLTTPPCTETVIWFVYTEVLNVTHEDLKPLRSKWIDDKKFSNGRGNNRNVQDLCGREIYRILADY